MTREEEIHKIANTISTNIGKDVDEDYICNDEYDFTIGFECGAKWADEHPNLYNMKLWIARNQDNSLHIHNVKPSPIYDDYTKQWTYEGDLSMEIDENLYSEVTFENSPQEVELNLVN